MTSQLPDQPANFAPLPRSSNVLPNPRTVRAQDLSWYNTRGGYIVNTKYDKCTGNVSHKKYQWNLLPPLPKTPFTSFTPVSNFDLFGVHCPQNKACPNSYKRFVSNPYSDLYDSRDCNTLYDNDGYIDPN